MPPNERPETDEEIIFSTLRMTGQSLEEYSDDVLHFSQAHLVRCDCVGRCNQIWHYHPEKRPLEDVVFRYPSRANLCPEFFRLY